MDTPAGMKRERCLLVEAQSVRQLNIARLLCPLVSSACLQEGSLPRAGEWESLTPSARCMANWLSTALTCPDTGCVFARRVPPDTVHLSALR